MQRKLLLSATAALAVTLFQATPDSAGGFRSPYVPGAGQRQGSSQAPTHVVYTPEPAGWSCVAPVSLVPTHVCPALLRASKTVRVIVPPGVTVRFFQGAFEAQTHVGQRRAELVGRLGDE